jgi:hypothetical protein
VSSGDDSESGLAALRTRAPLLPDDIRSWVSTTACVAIAYMLVAHGFLASGGTWQIPLFLGVLAGVLADTWAQAGLIAAVVVLALEFASPPVLAGGAALGAGGVAVSTVLATVASALTALGVGSAAQRRRGAQRVAVVVLVLWTLANLWTPLLAGGYPPTRFGRLDAATIRAVPQPGRYVNDDEIYRRVFYLMHQHVDYYHAFQQAWDGLRQHPATPNTVVAYRLPTMFWLWSLLPNDAFAIVPVFLAFVSVGAIAASFIAADLAGVEFAPLAALSLAAFAMGTGTSVYVTYVDLPAACLALAGIALFVRSRVKGDIRLLWAAAAALTVAALTREILAYLIVLAALTALLEPAGRRLRGAAPWLASLGVFSAGYALHAWAASSLIAPNSHALSYLKGSPAFALDALRRFSDYIVAGGAVLPALFLLGVIGAIAAYRSAGLPFAAFAVAALLVPVAVMTRFGNPALDSAGRQVNYWGNLFVPFALALWPVSTRLVPLHVDREAEP